MHPSIENKMNKLRMTGAKVICKNDVILSKVERQGIAYVTIHIDVDGVVFKLQSIEDIDTFLTPICEIEVKGKGKAKLLRFGSSDINNENKYTIKRLIMDVDTSNITNMAYMFSTLGNLEKIEFRRFDTSNTTMMQYMFAECKSLKELDLRCFDTSNVTSMSHMFIRCISLKKLDISSFDTSYVSSMNSMFKHCTLLEEINLSSFRTPLLESIRDTFYNCRNIKEIDISTFDLRNIMNMSGMAASCMELIRVKMPPPDRVGLNKVKELSSVFHNCNRLIDIDLSGLEGNKVTGVESMFENCNSLTRLDMRNFNPDKLEYIDGFAYQCDRLIYLDLRKLRYNSLESNAQFISSDGYITIILHQPKDKDSTNNLKTVQFCGENCLDVTSKIFERMDIVGRDVLKGTVKGTAGEIRKYTDEFSIQALTLMEAHSNSRNKLRVLYSLEQ